MNIVIINVCCYKYFAFPFTPKNSFATPKIKTVYLTILLHNNTIHTLSECACNILTTIVSSSYVYTSYNPAVAINVSI